MTETRTIKDEATGRTFTIRVLTPGQMLDLLEAAGKNSTNQGWVQYAMLVCSVAEIDGVPEPMPGNAKQMRVLSDKIGNSGIVALGMALMGVGGPEGSSAAGEAGDAAAPAAEEAQAEAAATAKN